MEKRRPSGVFKLNCESQPNTYIFHSIFSLSSPVGKVCIQPGRLLRGNSSCVSRFCLGGDGASRPAGLYVISWGRRARGNGYDIYRSLTGAVLRGVEKGQKLRNSRVLSAVSPSRRSLSLRDLSSRSTSPSNWYDLRDPRIRSATPRHRGPTVPRYRLNAQLARRKLFQNQCVCSEACTYILHIYIYQKIYKTYICINSLLLTCIRTIVRIPRGVYLIENIFGRRDAFCLICFIKLGVCF